MGKLKNIIGRRFGRLQVLERSGSNKSSDPLWKVKCDCGSIFVVVGRSLRKKNTRSCGCLRRKEGTALRNLVHQYKSNARKFKRLFSLTQKQFKILTSSACHYCGAPPSSQVHCSSGESYTYNGIDRKDSKKGYVKANCVPCCRDCNYMKRATPYEVFIEKCFIVSRRLHV